MSSCPVHWACVRSRSYELADIETDFTQDIVTTFLSERPYSSTDMVMAVWETKKCAFHIRSQIPVGAFHPHLRKKKRKVLPHVSIDNLQSPCKRIGSRKGQQIAQCEREPHIEFDLFSWTLLCTTEITRESYTDIQYHKRCRSSDLFCTVRGIVLELT